MSKLSLGVISSTDSWNWEDVHLKWFFESGIVGRIHSGNCLCNKACAG